MTNIPRPDSAPKRDDPPQAKGEKSPFERMRQLTRRVIQVPKSEIPLKRKRTRKRHP